MSELEGLELRDQDSADPGLSDSRLAEPEQAAPARPRAIGSPLSMGTSRHQPLSTEQGDVTGLAQAPPPVRALGHGAPSEEPPSSLQRTVSALRSFFPIVQRILPLVDGKIAAAASNFFGHRAKASAPAPRVDVAPIAAGLADLRIQLSSLRDQVLKQNTSLKRVEDQLEMVREATDRNTQEQQELQEYLKTLGNKVKMVVILALGLVAIGFILNLILYLHIQHRLP
jgi:hypothetical protein